MHDVNFYSSKKVSIALQQLEKPQLEIEKLNIKWNEVNYAENYKVEASTTTTIKETLYSANIPNSSIMFFYIISQSFVFFNLYFIRVAITHIWELLWLPSSLLTDD